MKTCAVKATVYVWTYVNLYLYVEYLLSNWYKVFQHNTV
jgi:hypothetical protein